eukprot:Tbor_TRINITY_DN5736_c0_g2::TRINITY_DN5736_c0_g2_i1::g.20947::m.20947
MVKGRPSKRIALVRRQPIIVVVGICLLFISGLFFIGISIGTVFEGHQESQTLSPKPNNISASKNEIFRSPSTPQVKNLPEAEKDTNVESPVSIGGGVKLPYFYPMHQNLPKNLGEISDVALERFLDLKSSVDPLFNCMHGQYDAPFVVDENSRTVNTDSAMRSLLQKEFAFDHGSLLTEYFYDQKVAVNQNEPNANSSFKWVSGELNEGDNDDDFGNLPCTSYVQRRIWMSQNNRDMPCSEKKYIASILKEGAHGIGSALILIGHDLLTAIMLNRVLVLGSKSKWYFSPQGCGDRSWSCFFQDPSICQSEISSSEISQSKKVNSKKEALHASAIKVIRKKTFDAPGIGRNDVPTDEEFFGTEFVKRNPKCYQRYKQWTNDPANVFISGTFSKGADRRLFFMLSQSLRFLMRYHQPWFAAMLEERIGATGFNHATRKISEKKSTNVGTSPRIYIQERGEIAKFREYYNTFGCHNIKTTLYSDIVRQRCTTAHPCEVFISGNTPKDNYNKLRIALLGIPGVVSTKSTWTLVDESSTGSSRWGASGLAASWVDLFAAVTATHWICIVQSNWCRVINMLRLTRSRALCPFLDAGVLMLTSKRLKDDYCIVNSSWPTKPFSNRIITNK